MMDSFYLFGEWRSLTLNAETVTALVGEARKHAQEFAAYPLDKTFRVLSALKTKWEDPNYSYRVEAKRRLPGETGFSPEMIELGMQALCSRLDPKVLERKLTTELGFEREGLSYNGKTGTALTWEPHGVLLHVLAGNVS